MFPKANVDAMKALKVEEIYLGGYDAKWTVLTSASKRTMGPVDLTG
jgi:hypothetical protein